MSVICSYSEAADKTNVPHGECELVRVIPERPSISKTGADLLWSWKESAPGRAKPVLNSLPAAQNTRVKPTELMRHGQPQPSGLTNKNRKMATVLGATESSGVK